MLIDYQLTQTGIILRVKIRNSSVATGAGLTGLTNASSGLIIAAIADNEATTTAYTSAGATIDTITTLGTYAAPTATHCRFKEVDATNHKGVYEIQLENSRYAVSNSKSLLVSISGATNAAECDAVIPLRTTNPYDVNGGLQGLKGTTNPTAGALLTSGTGTAQLNVSGGKAPATLAAADVSGDLPANVLQLNGLSYNTPAIDVSGRVQIQVGTGAGQINGSSGKVPATMGSTDYSGNTVQSGDAYALIGPGGNNLTSLAGSGPMGQVQAALIGAYNVAVVDAAPTASSFKTALLQADNYWNDCLLIFLNGNLANQPRPIKSYSNLNGLVTFDEAFTQAPANGDTFVIMKAHVHPVTQIATAVMTDVTDTVGADVVAIKAKTDSLTFTVAGVADVNVVDWKGSTAPANTGDAYAVVNSGTFGNSAIKTELDTLKSDLDNNTNGVGAIYTIVSSVTSGNAALHTQISNLQTHGDSTWATATGFASATVAPSWFPSHFTNTTFVSDGVFSVAALANAPGGAASDPWATAQPGTYAVGTFGNLVATNLPAIKAKTDTIVGGTATVTSPVAPNQNVTLYRGDDNRQRDGRALVFTFSGAPDLTGAAIEWYVFSNATTVLSTPGVVQTPTGSQQVYVELTAAQTLSIKAGSLYTHHVVALLANGDTATLVTGKVTVY